MKRAIILSLYLLSGCTTPELIFYGIDQGIQAAANAAYKASINPERQAAKSRAKQYSGEYVGFKHRGEVRRCCELLPQGSDEEIDECVTRIKSSVSR
jgi:hypothetical protein